MTSAKRGGKIFKKPQNNNWDETDSTVPDTTQSPQEELTKLIRNNRGCTKLSKNNKFGSNN